MWLLLLLLNISSHLSVLLDVELNKNSVLREIFKRYPTNVCTFASCYSYDDGDNTLFTTSSLSQSLFKVITAGLTDATASCSVEGAR